MHATDQELQTAVTEELRYTPGVDVSGVDVLVSNGTVTLSGKVTSLPGRLAAYHAVMRVAGVTNLVDQLAVDARATPTASDHELSRAAEQILRWSTEIPVDAVKAEVHNRTITLSGHVTWDYQRHAAVRAVRSLRGIMAVDNKITLDQPGPAHEAKAQVEAALRRQADLDASTINVEVGGSHLTLRGNVRSWSQRGLAERAAWSATGVTTVANHLQVTT
jgi:osmotically-inducible protein OsmY